MIKIAGSRCETKMGAMRGVVKFVGKVDACCVKEVGFWVGVELDDPMGDGMDGSMNGTKYFECKKKFGVFLRPDALDVGDYPEIDEFADSD